MTIQTKTLALAAARREAIEKLAYSLWQAAGCPEHSSLTFWLDAEREIVSQQPKTPVKAQPAIGAAGKSSSRKASTRSAA